MSLIEIEADESTLSGLADLPGLSMVGSTLMPAGADAFVVGAYAAEELYPELVRRGCRVDVTFSTDELADLHHDLEALVSG